MDPSPSPTESVETAHKDGKQDSDMTPHGAVQSTENHNLDHYVAASWLDPSLNEYSACKDPAKLSWKRKRKGKDLEDSPSTDGHGSMGNADSGGGDGSEGGEDSSKSIESEESDEGEDGEQGEGSEGIGPVWNDLLAQQRAEEDKTASEALLARIDLRAVECSDVGVRLSTPPFPFRQYWDPQYNTKKKRKAMMERRKSHPAHDYDDEDDEIKPQRKRLRASPDYTLGSFRSQ